MQELDNVQINFDANGLWVLNIALAVVMFGVALGIKTDDFKRLFKQPKLVLIGVLSQFILLPLLTFVLIVLIKPQPSIALGMMMVAACPGGNISNFMTHLAKGNTALSVSLTAFATFLAMFMTPFNFQFYGNLYEPTSEILKTVAIEPLELVKVVLMILGIPLVLGMLLRHNNETLAIKLSKLLKPLSIVVFVAIVIIAFSNNLDVFNDYVHHVLYIGIGHNLLAILLGFFVAKGFGLSSKSQKTLAIETGIQNSGLGLLLIFTFFNGLGGMAILAAFWGIWHIVSGLLLASYWSKQKNLLLKKLWLHSVRTYLRIGMFFYFKRIDIHGVQNVPKDKAVLLLGNHQNALLDALLIATKCGRFSYFLTRAAVFKKPLVSKLLKSLQMLPVYRIRDGWSNLSNNNAIFETCTSVLSNKQAVVIFPEGSHNLARRVRPLSKGFTRIVFDTLEKHPDLDIQLVPVGLNFVNATRFPDSTAMYFGEAISAKEYVSNNRNESVVALKERIKSELSQLTTHIPVDNYDETLMKLNTLNVDYLKPKEVNACIKSNFENCETTQKNNRSFIKSFFRLLMIINIFFPYLIWKYLVKPKIEEPEFISTFRFAIALTLVPIYLFSVVVLLSILLSLSVSLIYLFIVTLIILLAVKL